VSKFQQGYLASRETEAVEMNLGTSTALSKCLRLIGMNPAKERQGSARMPCRENRAH
jgi:hypothetical protein